MHRLPLSLTFRWSLHTTAPAMLGSARRIHRVPADMLRDALARRKPGGCLQTQLQPPLASLHSRRSSTPCVHCLHTGGPHYIWLCTPHVHRWPRSRRLRHAPRSSSSSCVATPSATWKRSHTHTHTIRVAASDAQGCSLSALCDVLCSRLQPCVREAATLCRSSTCVHFGCCTRSGCLTIPWRAGPTTAPLYSAGCRSSR